MSVRVESECVIMKTLTRKINLTRAAVLSALTIAPALALTSMVQAAPAHHDSAPSRQAPPTWNNGNRNDSRHETPRFDDHRGNVQNHPAPPVQAPRFDPHSNQGYGDNRNNAPRFDDHRGDNRNDGRFDARRDNDRNRNNGKSDTGKIIGAGIVGAILGAVLSH